MMRACARKLCLRLCHGDYNDYLYQVSLKSLREVQRYRVTRNEVLMDDGWPDRRTDGRTTGKHDALRMLLFRFRFQFRFHCTCSQKAKNQEATQ